MHDSHGHVRTGLVLAAVTVFGVVSHMIPHEMGVSTVGVVGMLSAAFLPRYVVFVPVFITVIAVDALNGFYSLVGMSFVYLGHVAAAYSTRPMLERIRPLGIVGASLASATVFFLLSNMTPMAMGFYPATLEGWLTCYINGIPFLWRGVLANLLFGGVAFGVVWLVGQSVANRLTLTQRH